MRQRRLANAVLDPRMQEVNRTRLLLVPGCDGYGLEDARSAAVKVGAVVISSLAIGVQARVAVVSLVDLSYRTELTCVRRPLATPLAGDGCCVQRHSERGALQGRADRCKGSKAK